MPRSHSRQTRRTARTVTLLIAGCLFLLGASLRVQTYFAAVDTAERLTLERLLATAWAATELIDADVHRDLQTTLGGKDDIGVGTRDERYLALHNALARVHRELKLKSPIYTYVQDSAGAIEFIVTSSEVPYYRHGFSTATAQQLSDYGLPGTLPVYESENGTWLSAYVPLRASDGSLVAMVQADEPFGDFHAAALASATAGIGWNVALFLLLLAVGYRFVSAILEREGRAREMLSAAVAEQTALANQLRRRERELAANAAQLERSNRELTDFANIASHDLKSPLRGIASFSQLLARRNRATLDDTSNEYLDFILGGARRALTLVDRLLEYAKVEHRTARAERFPLGRAVADAQANLFDVIEDTGAVVQVAPLPEASGDLTLVTQVFQNLIGNGIKYNRSETPEVHVGVEVREDGTRVFSVRDNGIGIPAEHQAAAFEMFRRLHGAGEYEGSGIGLAFCARVVGRYDGAIWLESAEGEGTTVFFTLPNTLGRGGDSPGTAGEGFAVEVSRPVGEVPHE